MLEKTVAAIKADKAKTLDQIKKDERTLPIVFVGVVDPVGGGLVDSLARPGGNAHPKRGTIATCFTLQSRHR